MIRLIQRRLIIPRGDTGAFSIPTTAATSIGDVAIFTIFDSITRTKLFEKNVEIEGNSVTFNFSHNDTVNLKPGKYLWDIKFYKNPVFADGKLVNGEEIDSLYAGFSLPDCEIRETGDDLLISPNAPTATLSPAQLDIISSALIEIHEAVEQTEANVEHYPTIIENVWYLWDADLGEYVSTGVHANCIPGGTTGQVYRKHSDADYDAEWGDETDPTVPAWAKAAQKPSYTAAEVGALPDDTFIPSNTSDLNNDSNFAVDANYVHTDNNYTTEEKNKLTSIAAGAEVNVNADWNAVNGDAQILNKPTNVSAFTNDAGYLTQHQDISGKLDSTLKGAANGLAELDAEGKVPSSQLPSYVDDILEYAAVSSFPAIGETGKIYVAKDTNLTYRWGGSEYVEISQSLALGETSSTAYRGDYGAAAYAHGVTNKGNAFTSGLYKITTNSEGHVTAAAEVQKSDITILGIPAQDTTYESKSAVNGGTDVSLVTTGEKYGWNNKVDKSAINNAGIQSKTYTTLFGGEFTVTTVQTSGYTNPRATYSVTTPSFDKNTRYRIIINDAEYVLNGRVWKIVNYSAGTYSEYTYIGKHAIREPNIPIVDDPDITFCIKCLTNALEISTSIAGTYTILIEAIAETYTKIPNELLYGTPYPIIEKDNNSYAVNYSFLGPNCMKSYGGIVIGDNNTVTGEWATVFGANNLASARGSAILGEYNQANGAYCTVVGSENIVNGQTAYSEGFKNTSSGQSSHTEGQYNTANGNVAHAEGYNTIAEGLASHSEGRATVAMGSCQHVGGKFNVLDTYESWAEWVSNTEYQVGDKVKITTIDNNNTTVTGYQCKTSNSDSTFTASKWSKYPYINYAEIIGNGTADNARSNARTLDWDGNERLKGDLYVGANTDGTGGTKVATVSQIPTVPVTDVQINGSSILSSGVANIPIANSTTLGTVIVDGSYGLQMDSGTIKIKCAGAARTKAGTNAYEPIVASHQHEATFYGLAKAAGDSTQSSSSNSVGLYTDDAKDAIQQMLGIDSLIAAHETSTATAAHAIGEVFIMNSKLYKATSAIAINDVITVGTNCEVVKASDVFPHDVQVNGTSILSNGVANVPVASASAYGAVKVHDYFGIGMISSGTDSGRLYIKSATASNIKGGTDYYHPICPERQHEVTFYGLAKAAGSDLASTANITVGTYPAATATAIKTMLQVEEGLRVVRLI